MRLTLNTCVDYSPKSWKKSMQVIYVCINRLDSTSFNWYICPEDMQLMSAITLYRIWIVIPSSHPFLGYFISVSAKGFYKEQPVIDFLCETQGRGVTPQSLENRNFRFDKQRFEKAIRGKNA